MKKRFGTSTLTLVAASLMVAATAAMAGPVSFAITNTSITPGSGYGVDTGNNPENGGTLLDVVFSTSAFTTQEFSLAAVGDSHSFQVGTVTFREPDIGPGDNLGISNSERDSLDVTFRFTFTNPMGEMKEIQTSGVATAGPISDPAVDFSLSWNPLEVLFGNSGLFQLSLNTLTFASNIEGAKALYATVTMRALPQLLPVSPGPEDEQPGPAVAVPEPASLALLGLGLAGLGALRRRQRSA